MPHHKQEQHAASDKVTEVASSIIRMQLPISMPGLGHVNAYAVLDDHGCAVVDTGVPGPTNWRALGHRLRDAGMRLEDVHTVIVTHSHHDHFGAAGRLVKESGADLVTHHSFDAAWRRGRHRPQWGGRSRGGPPLRRRLQWRLMRLASHAWSPPVPTKPVGDGGELELGGRRFVGLHTPGHTKDHLCLYDPEGGVLLSGDHVLPTITPHISGMWGGSDDPLTDFFASLEKVSDLDVSIVLPAHGHPFEDLKGRCKAIHDHHLERLDKLLAAADAHGEATIEELSREIFERRHWGFMAESETYAHLEHLRLQGRAERVEAPDGTVRYRLA